MNTALKAAIRSYHEGSLASLKASVRKDILDSILERFVDIAKEVDNFGKATTSCFGLKSYLKIDENTKLFLQELLRGLNKSVDGLEVIDVLEKWGVMSKHENIAIWKEDLQFRKRFGEDLKNAALSLVHTATRNPLDASGRTNCINTVSFAIDKSSTRDVDDAISCDITTNTVSVHIAAPAEYVHNERSHILIEEASRRLLSIYSCRDRLPMFPDEVSNNLFSLKCGSQRVRYATTFVFQIKEDGEINSESMQVQASIISRPVCLSYRNVSDILNSPDHGYHRVIKVLERLALLRREWRYSKGHALQYSGNGQGFRDSSAHLIVDEMMISANTVAAQLARAKGVPVLYRGVSGGNFFTVSGSRYSSFRGTKHSCSMHVSGTKQRDMEKGANVQLHVRPVRHAGLGLDEYVQATSPIRKFSDLIVHCQFNAIIRSQPLPFSEKDLLETKDKIIRLEQAAGRIERRAKKYWAYQQLLKQGSKGHKGVLRSKVSDMREHGYTRTKSQLLKKMVRRREQEATWVVFLKDVECDIKATVPFWGRTGMEVGVHVYEVNPRTSHIVARAFSQ